MATSSFNKRFIVEDPKEINKLLTALENPVDIYVQKRDPAQAEQDKQALLCSIKEQLLLMKSSTH